MDSQTNYHEMVQFATEVSSREFPKKLTMLGTFKKLIANLSFKASHI